jgi:acetolactate synthase I/II/III large subunit
LAGITARLFSERDASVLHSVDVIRVEHLKGVCIVKFYHNTIAENDEAHERKFSQTNQKAGCNISMNQRAEGQAVTLTGAEAVVEMLKAHGVEVLFGLCGDTSLPFYDALARLPHGMRHVLTRDERSAAYMADGYARVSGKVGVCEGPSGGGATYILPGLAEANESSVPVLCINSDISVAARGRYTLTELDQGALMRPVTKWNAVLDRAQDIPRVFRAAFNQMTTGRPGAAHIALPFDVQNGSVERADVWGDASLGRYPARRVAPDPYLVERAAQLLGDAAQPVFICGGGAVIAGAEEELLKLAERLSASVATTISGKGSISEEHPLSVGVVGSNGGTPETRGIVDQADLVVFIGCRAGSVTTERWRHPPPGKVKVIHLDVDPAVLGANYRVDLPLLGDAKLALAGLNETLATLRRPLEATVVQEAKEQKFAGFNALAWSNDKPIKPERVVAEVAQALDPDAMVVADAGTPCPYFSAYYQVRSTGRRFFSNRAHGALGYSMSAAIGAHFARPQVKCVSVMGDGSFGFTCGELETAVRHRLPITFIVISNSTYGWIKAGQKSGYGQRYFAVDFDPTDHAAVAAAFGVKGWRVTEPKDLAKVLKEALAQVGPSLVDIVCQPLHEAKAPVSEWVA